MSALAAAAAAPAAPAVDERPSTPEAGHRTAPAAPPRPQAVKLSFNVAPHQVDTLKRLADERGVTMTEVLRHAIALEDFVQNEVAQGGRLFVEDDKGNRKEVVLIGP